MPPYDPNPQIIQKSLEELDFNFLGEKLGDFDFLKGCLRNIPETYDAIVKYNRMDQQKVRETIERLLKLTE